MPSSLRTKNNKLVKVQDSDSETSDEEYTEFTADESTDCDESIGSDDTETEDDEEEDDEFEDCDEGIN